MAVTDQILKDFPAVSPEDWTALFLKETKQEQIQLHHSYLGYEFLPFYTPHQENAVQVSLLQQLSAGREERWYITRYIAIDDAAKVNKKILEALNKGVSSITLVGDIRSENDADILLKEVQANYIEINFLCHEPLQTAKYYLEGCKRTGADTKKVFGAFHHDPIAEALLNGDWKNGKEKDLDLLAEEFKYLAQHTEKVRCICIDATIYHYAGASLVQTIGYALAHAMEYLQALQERGIDPEAAIERIVFKWPVGTSFFAEIAALRALRLAWNSLCRHLTNKNHLYKAYVQAETSLHTWSVADMYNNMLRATTQAMSAIAGGASSLYICPYNVVSTNANEFSERMAVNVQLLLREESFFAKAADPAAGAYLVETLTRQLAEKALDLLKRTESEGGLLQLVQQGTLQRELEQNMVQMTEALKKGEIKILGANLYPNKNENIDAIPKAELFNQKPAGNAFVPLKRQRLAAILEGN